jgi:hypothetical protein
MGNIPYRIGMQMAMGGDSAKRNQGFPDEVFWNPADI